MPDRPKRRKNKNKRKNKNNRSDINKSSSDVNDTVNSEPCSAQNSNIDPDEKPNDTHFANEAEIAITPAEAKLNLLQNTNDNDDTQIQDIINNSNVLQMPLTVTETDTVVFVENVSPCTSEDYVVESPEQSLRSKQKIGNNFKSKSLDNDDAPKIIELTEENIQSEDDNSLAIIDSSSVIVSDVESDVEWEKTDDFQEDQVQQCKEILATGTISITTIPLNVAQCEQTNALTPEAEKSLRHYLHTLNLTTQPSGASSVEINTEIQQIINQEIRHRLRKKGLAEDFLTPRLGPSRILDVIDEEGSSESSVTSRRHSHLSDKKSDNEDLDDDVFEEKNKIKEKYATKSVKNLTKQSFGRQVPQKCLLVGAKLKEPEITEARGDWSMKTVEKMTGAEVVYLTDSSSSTSSIHEFGDDTDDGDETDVSIRMITPTIEVTDTESLLKKLSVPTNEAKSENELGFSKLECLPSENSESTVNEIEKIDSPSKDNGSENLHEIIVLSTDNIKTDLYVKDLETNVSKTEGIAEKIENTEINQKTNKSSNSTETSKDKYDLEIKVLKCELNDAFNNLIKEVVSDSETSADNSKDKFVRQDSSSSVCSSQCTAKYNPNYSSLNDVSNIMHDDISENITTNTAQTQTNNLKSHVKDVFECVSGAPTQSKTNADIKKPSTLRDICVRKISTFPYGDKILEELASVSERLQNITISASRSNDVLKETTEKDYEKSVEMPYFPLPDVSAIEKVALQTNHKIPIPPPVQPRNSSLKKSQEDHWTGLPTKTEPVYVCLSPSQKMLMEKTNTVVTKEDASQLVDMHKKFVDRRGYNENHLKKERHEDHHEISPVIPFKSQTGSRLLALIRDPAVTNNINTVLNNNHGKGVDHLDKSYLQKTMRVNDQFRSTKDFSSNFRPIPPPRPRKYSSSFYESDESSDFTDNSFRSMKSEKKFFHYSTGNLSKEIENDVSSIQNMHRRYTNFRDELNTSDRPRRPSLPKDICDQQMEYIRQKEKEVEAEIRRLEEKKINTPERRGPKAPLVSNKEIVEERISNNDYYISRKRDFAISSKSPEKGEKGKLSSLFSSSQEELLREKMYSEYVNQMAERQERKEQKIIKITNYPSVTSSRTISKSMPALDVLDSKVNNRIEKEFISRARERWNKLGIKDPETEDERETGKDIYTEPKIIEHKIKVIEGGEEKDVQKLPSHLQDFVRFTTKDKEQSGSAVWRPGAPTPPPAPAAAPAPAGAASPGAPAPPPPPPPPVWVPGSAGASPQAPRKSFRPVHFEDTPPTRRKFGDLEQNGCTSGSESEGRLRTSLSAPASGLNSLGGPNTASRLPRAQNPTVTLLQKAREGHIPRGSSYLSQDREGARLPRDRPSPPRGDPVHALRKEYASEGEADRSDYERGGPRKMADAHRKVEGIGPTTKEGMPVALRSEVKDPSRWYKKMYDTIHKNKYDDDYVTIRYKSRRGQPPQRVSNKSQYAYFDPRSGYLSEPEGGLGRLGSSTWSDAYDSDVTTGPRRRTASVQEERRNNDITSPYLPSNKYSTLASARASQEVYKNQPGRIENYVPGKSSVVDKEAKQWWDEVMDIFDGQNISSTTSLPQASPKEKKDITSAILSKSNMARALKESGYESDSTLIFRRREEAEAPLSPAERRAAYRDLQAGGEPPLRGFRSPAPPRQESPRRYVESDVNIHYRCPVRHDPLPLVPERELARQQAEHMKRLYREQRRNKYLQELQDMQNRRHQDNFTPAQKNILPLNRYDEAEKIIARALYAFNGQTSRELSFRKGDMIHVRRQIDANWYEGELHGRIGLFPYNYVEILKGDVAQSPRKPVVIEGRARAKFDFTAQTNLELPLKKGELVVLTRRIDQNWWEGRNGNKTGIFPDSYVTVLQEPSQSKPEPLPVLNTDKPVASPAAHGLLNGSAKRSMGSHSYTPQPNSPALANAPPATQPLPGYVAKPAQATLTPSERGYGPPTGAGVDLNNTEPLYVDTNAEAIPYRAMYKYRPQNPDELELNEGDTVYVLEQCDDGWYVGSSQRTGRFGTFPGNYVERI